MRYGMSEKLNVLEVVKVLPEKNKEVCKEITDTTTINSIMDKLDYEKQSTPLLHDVISPRYLLKGWNGSQTFKAQVLRRFISFGGEWLYIKNEAFLEQLEKALSDVEPSSIEKSKEGDILNFQALKVLFKAKDALCLVLL